MLVTANLSSFCEEATDTPVCVFSFVSGGNII